MKFNFIELPANHTFDSGELTFLQTIDKAFSGFQNCEKEKFSDIQKQLDLLFVKIATSRYANNISTDRAQSNEWLQKFFKRQFIDSLEKETGIPYLATDPDAAGGVLVPELLLAEIKHYTEEVGIARRKMQLMPFSGAGNMRRIPKETGSVSVYWVDEAGRKPVSNLVFDEVVLHLKKIAVVSIMSEEIIADAAVDLTGYVSRRIAEKIAFEEDRVYFTGQISAGDPFNGVLYTPAVKRVNLPALKAIKDIRPEDLLKLVYALPQSARRNGEFYFHSDLMHFLQKLRIDLLAPGDALGGYLISQPTGNEPLRLWGYPINFVDHLPGSDLTGTDAPFGLFSNLAKTCIYGEKNGIQIKLLDQATIADGQGNQMHLAQQDAVALRVHKRTGYLCAMPEGVAIIATGKAS